MKDAVSHFLNKQKQLKEGGMDMEMVKEQIGTPSVHVVNSLFMWTISKLEEEKATKLKQNTQKWEGWKHIQVHVPHCKMCKTYHGHTK
eukprot:10958182-Karenia_brevis.AAC.1